MSQPHYYTSQHREGTPLTHSHNSPTTVPSSPLAFPSLPPLTNRLSTSHSPQPSPSLSSQRRTNSALGPNLSLAFPLNALILPSQPQQPQADQFQANLHPHPRQSTSQIYNLESFSVEDLTAALNRFQPSFLISPSNPRAPTSHFGTPLPATTSPADDHAELKPHVAHPPLHPTLSPLSPNTNNLDQALLSLVPHHHRDNSTPAGFVFQNPFVRPRDPALDPEQDGLDDQHDHHHHLHNQHDPLPPPPANRRHHHHHHHHHRSGARHSVDTPNSLPVNPTTIHSQHNSINRTHNLTLNRPHDGDDRDDAAAAAAAAESSSQSGDDTATSIGTTLDDDDELYDYCLSTMILNGIRFYHHLTALIDHNMPFNYALDRLYEAVTRQLFLQYDIDFVQISHNRFDLVQLLREFVFSTLRDKLSLTPSSPQPSGKNTNGQGLALTTTETAPGARGSVSSVSQSASSVTALPSSSSAAASPPHTDESAGCCGCGGGGRGSSGGKSGRDQLSQSNPQHHTPSNTDKSPNSTTTPAHNDQTIELVSLQPAAATTPAPKPSQAPPPASHDSKLLESFTDDNFAQLVHDISERFATLHYLTNRSLYKVQNKALNEDFKSHTHHGHSITHFNSRGEPVELIIKEHEYIYTEKDLYEEGVAFRITWAKQCAASVLKSMLTPQRFFRYHRDNRLENGLTNMFHFNGDRIRESGFFFNRVSFDIAEPSGHQLHDDELCSMIFAADWATGCYNAHSVGHAMRYEFGPYRSNDEEEEKKKIVDTINNNYDHLSHLSHQLMRHKKKGQNAGIEFYTTPIHHTIHGGDIYYTGSKDEVHNNFLGGEEYCARHSVSLRKRLYASLRHLPKKPKPETILVKDRKGRDRLQFPHGTIGRWASCGNHEMLSGGHAFKKCVLASMGVFTVPTNITPKFAQYTSFFTLENAYWRIVNLDTAYFSQPFGHPGLCTLHVDGNDCNCTGFKKYQFPPDLVAWLDNTARLSADNRGLIFVSHHMHTSAIEISYRFILKEVEQRIGTHTLTGQQRTIIWLAGDEHLTAIYHPYQADPNTVEPHHDFSHNSYLFCLGATGMPARLFEDHIDNPTLGQKGLVLYDGRIAYTRSYTKGGTFNIGHPSFLRMDFNQAELTFRVRSLNSVPDIPQTAKRIKNSCHRFIVDDAYDIARYTFRIDLETGILSLPTEPWFKEEPRLLSVNPSPPHFFNRVEEFLPFYQKLLIHCPKHPFRSKLPDSIDDIKFPMEVRQEHWELLHSLPDIHLPPTTSPPQQKQQQQQQHSQPQSQPPAPNTQNKSLNSQYAPQFLGSEHFFSHSSPNSSHLPPSSMDPTQPLLLSSSLTSRRRGSSKHHNVVNVAPQLAPLSLVTSMSTTPTTITTTAATTTASTTTISASSLDKSSQSQQQHPQQQQQQQQHSFSSSLPSVGPNGLPSLELHPSLHQAQSTTQLQFHAHSLSPQTHSIQPPLLVSSIHLTEADSSLPSAQSIAASLSHRQLTADLLFTSTTPTPTPTPAPNDSLLLATQAAPNLPTSLSPHSPDVTQPTFHIFHDQDEFAPIQDKLEHLFPLGGLRLYQLIDHFPIVISMELYQHLAALPELDVKSTSSCLSDVPSSGQIPNYNTTVDSMNYTNYNSNNETIDLTPPHSILNVPRFGPSSSAVLSPLISYTESSSSIQSGLRQLSPQPHPEQP